MNQLIETCWKFLRKDISSGEFEKWIYSNSQFESFFGNDLYFQLISKNYNNKEGLSQIREILRNFLMNFKYKCSCIKISNLDVIGMGSEEQEYLESFEEIKKRGNPYWWLYLSRCKICNTYWLIAQEEKINDDFCLKRLNLDESTDIIKNDSWTSDFDSYENLLKLEKSFGHSARFIDPLSSSLVETTTDLINERDNLTIEEISVLLNVDLYNANELLKIARKNKRQK